MWTYRYSTSPELYHYGVKGMKWGVVKEILYNSKDYIPKDVHKQIATNVAADTAKSVAKRSAFNAFDRSKSNNRHVKDVQAYRKQMHQKVYDQKIKDNVKNMNSNYSKRQAAMDYRDFGIKGVNRINKSINKGHSYQFAYSKEIGRQAVASIPKEIAKQGIKAIAKSAFHYYGQQYVNQNLREEAYNNTPEHLKIRDYKVYEDIHRL